MNSMFITRIVYLTSKAALTTLLFHLLELFLEIKTPQTPLGPRKAWISHTDCSLVPYMLR